MRWKARFYTDVPDAADNPFWNHFWQAKGAQMGRQASMSVHARCDTETNK